MFNLNPEIFTAFQNKLKTGNRRGVHLNAIPGNSRYKFDLAQLAEIHKSLPEHFIVHLLTHKNVSFKFSVHDQFINQDEITDENERDYLNEYEDLEIPEPEQKSVLDEDQDKKKEKLKRSLENLIFQNEVIFSEKGVNSLGFGFPILIRKDISDGQITAAPLLIWSIDIKPTNEMNTWEICRSEDDPIYLNEVLINHLQSDSGVALERIPDQMLEDGKIDKPELFEICDTILKQLKVNQNLDFILSNYAEIPAIKTKMVYDDLLPQKGDAFITKSGIFSIFEVQKQNIINDYEVLKSNFKTIEQAEKKSFQSITAIETDPSQQNVLETLKFENKILIQGPPGTGKSQTLTAILVNALENKQKTIVVCEKQTALEVLQNAMDKLGFGKFCIMIKDSVKDRKLVVNAVRNTIDNPEFKKFIASDSFAIQDDQIVEIQNHQLNINTVHKLLNQNLVADLNRTEIVGSLLETKEKQETLDLKDIIFKFSNDEFKEIEAIVDSGFAIYKEYKNFVPFSFLNPNTLIANNFHSSLQNLDLSFQNYRNLWDEIQKLILQYQPDFNAKKKTEFARNSVEMNSLIDETEILTSTLDANSDVFLPQITNRFFYKLSSFFSSTKKKNIQTQKKLLEIASAVKKISLNSFFQPLEISSDLWRNRNEIISYRQKIEVSQNQFDVKSAEIFDALDFNNVFDVKIGDEQKSIISNKIQQLKKDILADNWLLAIDFGNNFIETRGFLDLILERYAATRNQPENPLLAEYNWFSFYAKTSEFQKRIIDKLYIINDWKVSLLGAYFPFVLNHFASIQLNFNENEYSDFTKKLKQYGFSQKVFIENFWNFAQREAVKNFEKENKDITVANLYNKRSSTNYSRLTLRQIAQKDTDLFTTFFPIILTTPDVCSNLFQDKNYYFDYVVFDEASQLKLEDNLPALLKGKNIIIAGDEHQMPPSNYFSKIFDGSIQDEEDQEDEEDVITYKNAMLNIESLLDFGMENNFEKNHLDFHYRSKHPYLIDFSNHAFYNSRLKPLPARSETKPIEFFQVNGIFDDHINKEEAEKVLEILGQIEEDENGKYPSVGIATFNITQRNYIKRQILHKSSLPENDAFKEKIQRLEEQGLFIKNLENIQGDERDIIIISTTYGKKPNGKFVQSFGPVNHSKGYKLLNVIITRAKEKIYICNSIPEDFFMRYKEAIEEEGQNNRKAVFYAYLAYCKAVSNENESERKQILDVLDVFGFKINSEKEAASNIFTDQIYQILIEKYPEIEISKYHQFGGYVLDLVIKNAAGKFIVVECMSKEIYNGDLAYLQDLHKAKILQNANFEYVRIWSQNCWQNLEAELQKIVRKIA